MDSIRWEGNALHLLDQRLLPSDTVWLTIDTWQATADAIADMVVRGAPAIAITAAYGLALAVRTGADRAAAVEGLRSARPTAVNLRWALDRLESVADKDVESV